MVVVFLGILSLTLMTIVLISKMKNLPPIHVVTFTFTKAFLNCVCFAFILKTSFYLFIEQLECECNTLFGFAVL